MWIGLTLAFASTLVTNTAYSLEHDAAAALPPLSPRRPFRSAQVLLRDRRWLIAFAAESAGWLMYVAALRLRRHPGDCRADAPCAIARRHHGVRSASWGSRPHHLACGVRRRRGAAHRHTDALRPRRITRTGSRPAVRRRRHLREARRLRRAVAGRAGHAHRRLRHRDERTAVGLPAGRRADGGGHGDNGHQRGPDRGRVRAVRRDAAPRDASRPADRSVLLPGSGCSRAWAPAGATGR